MAALKRIEESGVKHYSVDELRDAGSRSLKWNISLKTPKSFEGGDLVVKRPSGGFAFEGVLLKTLTRVSDFSSKHENRSAFLSRF